jgi:hypothetical protein
LTWRYDAFHLRCIESEADFVRIIPFAENASPPRDPRLLLRCPREVSTPSLLDGKRHASEAEVRVIRQMAIIAELVRDNHPRTVDVARKILVALSKSLDRAPDYVR